jgi:hypothetical protein
MAITTLSAFRAGFQGRRLRHHLKSLWSEDLRRVMDIDPVLLELDGALIGLSSLMSSAQEAAYADQRSRILELEESAKLDWGDPYFEADPAVPFLRRLRADQILAARGAQLLQEEVCDQLRLLLSAITGRDARLAAWHEIGRPFHAPGLLAALTSNRTVGFPDRYLNVVR